MKIIHRIGLRATSSQRRELERLGLSLPPGLAIPGGGDPLLAFDVTEDHPAWSELKALLCEWGESEGVVRTEFTKSELAKAAWLELTPAWHHGFPQPNQDVFGYRGATYDLSGWCEHCGVGLRQKAPFQMTGEPKWGRNSILQLNWVFDEFFVTPDLWASVFRPAGVAFMPVLDPGGAELRTVVQLVVEEGVEVETNGLVSRLCSWCGRIKFEPVPRGEFPALRAKPAAPIAKTSDYFGSGFQADRRVLISQNLAKILLDMRVRGLSLRPVRRG